MPTFRQWGVPVRRHCPAPRPVPCPRAYSHARAAHRLLIPRGGQVKGPTAGTERGRGPPNLAQYLPSPPDIPSCPITAGLYKASAGFAPSGTDPSTA